ncbi:GIY-YIG nuclease family protein [Caballeronia sp. SBC1]|uniref:GIY-YIG nuclease family protein n=1 Tax=Caballeronia sp. SBC1 TaxID=2705548 RepID=UPI00140A3A4F|nr:GIY-YIG nuclease family protein [Caballeronia sp. SBC1]
MRARPRTIQITEQSPDLEPIRVAIYTAGIMEATHVPRERLAEFFKMQQACKPSVYILFGKRNEDKAYIGQTGNQAGHRLQHHGWNRSDWHHALVLTSRVMDAFNAAHARYLENYCMEQANAAGRYPRGNQKNGDAGHVGQAMEWDCQVFFDEVRELAKALGFPVFHAIKEDGVVRGHASGRQALEFGRQNSEEESDMVPLAVKSEQQSA